MKKKIILFYLSIGICISSLKAQIYLKSIPNTNFGGSAQIALDSTGAIYFGTVRFASDSQYVVRHNPGTNTIDSLLKIPFRIAGIEISNRDSILYFTHSTRIWKYNLATKNVKQLYGGFEYPTVLRLRKKTSELYVIEVGGDNGRAAMLSKINIQTGQRTKIAGGINGSSETGYVNGFGDDVRFRFLSPNGPFKNGGGLAFSPNEDTLYIGDANNRCIRKLNVPSGEVSTFAGPLPDSVRMGFRDGFRFDARFNTINGIAVDKKGYLFVADNGPFSRDSSSGNRIRKISPDGLVKTVVGSGIGRGNNAFDNLDFVPGLIGTKAIIGNLNDIVFNTTKDTLYISQNQRISKVSKRKSSLKFANLQDREIGSGKVEIKTSSNSKSPILISPTQLPVNVSLANDTVNVTANAEPGLVKLKAVQNEDLDSIFTTIVEDSFKIKLVTFNAQEETPQINLYPNPVQQTQCLILDAKNLSGSKLNIEILDIMGKLLGQLHLAEEDRIKIIPLPNLAGIYLVKINYKDKVLKNFIFRN